MIVLDFFSVLTQWSQWTQCHVTCGNGQQTRFRTCSVPGGCIGSLFVEKQCTLTPCPGKCKNNYIKH